MDRKLEIREKIDNENLPEHIAIIMDGNGRWAKKRFLPRNFGHQEGMERVIEIVEASRLLGIKNLTLYAFSTENWKRPEEEVSGLMKLLLLYIRRELNKLQKNGIRLNILGDISKLPKEVRDEIINGIAKTKDNNEMILNIALNYGGRDEIINGIKDVIKDVNLGNIDIEKLDSKMFSDYLYTKGQPDPDLIIRPSGELRLSNFLLYQAAYSEFWFSDVLWPDFKEENLYKAILDYQRRNRRFGGV